MNSNTKTVSLFLLGLLLAVNALATEPDPLFQSSEILEFTFTGPFKLIDRERDKEEKYEAQVAYLEQDGTSTVLDLDLEVRGNNRLKRDVCSYSQLWMDFKNRQTPGTLFENTNKTKLVVQCRSSDRYADYLIKEHQAYQLFNLLSDKSFATRFARITYVDSEDPSETRTHFGFFIEHQERLADRFSMTEFEEEQILIRQLDQEQSDLVALFMYFISNTDYSMIQGQPDDECCHNTKLIVSEDGAHYPIPYDFDSSGFVDTSYAEPSAAVRQRNVRQRVYRGFCVPETVTEKTLANFSANRDAIYALISDTSLRSERNVNRTVKYIDDFYEVIDDPRKLQREILSDCRG